MIKHKIWPDEAVWIDETVELTPTKRKQLEELIAPRILAQLPAGVRFIPNPVLHSEISEPETPLRDGTVNK